MIKATLNYLKFESMLMALKDLMGPSTLSLMTSLHVEDSEVFKTVDIEVIGLGLEHVAL